MQQEHYYPFGMPIRGEWKFVQPQVGGVNYYQYNGKELNDDFDLNWNDYGARWYDASIGRWNAVDPLAEDYLPWSGYNYVLGNPLKFIDPDGMRGDIGQQHDWVPDYDPKTSKLIVSKEKGDNAASLANFLDIDINEATALYNTMNEGGTIDVPIDIAEPFNNSLADVKNPSGADYRNDNLPDFFETNYNCWEACISISQGKTPEFDWLFEQQEFGREIRNFYSDAETPDDYQFGRTAIRFGLTEANILGASSNRTTHGAIYLGTSGNGTIYVWTKDGKIDAPRITTLQQAVNQWGPVEGYRDGESGFYNFQGK